MSGVIAFAGQLEKLATRKGDKTLVLTIGTQSLKPESESLLLGVREKLIHIYIFEVAPSSDEDLIAAVADNMPEPVAPKTKVKTNSQKLRETFFKLHIRQGGTKESFDTFYDTMMGRVIKFYDDKAEAIEQ